MQPADLVVIPEGITINYLTGIPSPLTFHTFTPPETAAPETGSLLLAELTAHPPQMIAIVTRGLQEYGSHGFGVDYDARVAAFIDAGYATAASWDRGRFRASLMERRGMRGSPSSR